MISRDEALCLLQDYGASASLMRHALASEAVMVKLAERLDQDQEVWGRTGLLHDLDFPRTEAAPENHGLETAQILAGKMPEDALDAIRAHNGEMNGQNPATIFDYALRCGETVTGLIAAAALMRPTGYDGMEVKSIKKKMKDKAFAANVSRANINQCSEIGLGLDEFLALAISAMAEQSKNAQQGGGGNHG